MKNKIIALIIFSFFILIFQPVYAEDVYVYVDDLPEWADHASRVMYLSTTAWEEANKDLKFYKVENYSDSDFTVKWVKEFGGEYVGYAYGNKFVEVGLGDSDCGGNWNPYSERHISHIMKHEIGHIFGKEHDEDNPNSIMYPIALNKEYDIIEKEYRLSEGYAQFVKFCTIQDLTSYEFSITTTDETHGFDYYVIPSHDEFIKWGEGKAFQHYSNSDCFGDGWLNTSGTCKGISKGSGIMIVMNNELTTQLETITVKQLEKPNIVNYKSPLTTKLIPFEEEHETSIFDDKYLVTILQDQIRELEEKISYLESSINKLEHKNKQLKNELNLEKSPKKDLQNNLEIASFVDQTKNPQDYIDRYNNEPIYKKWFDDNYPQYSSIEEAIGFSKSDSKLKVKPILSFVDTSKDPQDYIDRYNNEPIYKKWFDDNYPNYTIEEAVGLVS